MVSQVCTNEGCTCVGETINHLFSMFDQVGNLSVGKY